MPKFSQRSLSALTDAHPALQILFHEVVKHFDCTVLCGHRGEEEQMEMVRTGVSQLPWPKSKHNTMPSLAVDVVPYPIDWENKERFYHFAGFVKGVASQLGTPIIWGGDWTTFIDMPHYELTV